jgi:hypothetical protein
MDLNLKKEMKFARTVTPTKEPVLNLVQVILRWTNQLNLVLKENLSCQIIQPLYMSHWYSWYWLKLVLFCLLLKLFNQKSEAIRPIEVMAKITNSLQRTLLIKEYFLKEEKWKE